MVMQKGRKMIETKRERHIRRITNALITDESKVGIYFTHDAVVELLELLIEQPEPCEDAVSRKSLLRWVKTETNPYGKPTLDYESGLKVMEHIEKMPPVTPKRKKGKWIRNDNGTWSCDQCNSWIPDEQHYYANWCLYCGADMRERREE